MREMMPIEQNYNQQARSISSPMRTPPVPLLREVLARLNPCPSYSMLMGVCDDDLPLLLDLSNPAAGSVLVVSDVQYGNTLFVKTMLASAYTLNTPQQV